LSDLKKSLIYLEQNNFQNSAELLEVVRRIHGPDDYETYGVSFGQDCKEAEGLFDCPIRVRDNSVRGYDVPAMTNILEELHLDHQFDSILFPATQTGRMLAPRLAMRLHTGLVADITAVNRVGGDVEIVRPAFGGKLMAGIVSKEVPLMMSVRRNVFSYQTKDRKKTLIAEHQPKRTSKSCLELLETREKEGVRDIRDSEILISGGGGVMRDFGLLNALANEMNAQVSASRKTVDSGIAPRSIQVGQSGKTVSPRLYMALGINGSIQHIQGLKNVENIISVNTYHNAPIFSISDIAVEGDAKEFILKLIDKIKKERNKNQ
jgi:electron transfer flavoprotein alpha subunit